jgi:hypothetical protein
LRIHGHGSAIKGGKGKLSPKVGVLPVLHEWITLQGRGAKRWERTRWARWATMVAVDCVSAKGSSALVWLVQTGISPPRPCPLGHHHYQKRFNMLPHHLRLPLLPSDLRHCAAAHCRLFDIPGPSLWQLSVNVTTSAVSNVSLRLEMSL